MPVLHFSSVSALFEKEGLKYKINRMHKFTYTNKYRHPSLYAISLYAFSL